MKKKLSLILAAVMLLAILSACAKPTDKSGKYALTKGGEAVINNVEFSSDYVTDDNNRVFYEIFVGSFSDSDGDGTGDLRGIINRMDYLNDGDPDSGLSLGVEGLWLTPIFASPSYHKYDVTNYYAVDSAFGTEDDLKELISLCHKRNVKIILDLPINHTGSMNEWFAKFKKAHQEGDTSSKYYNYYCWYRSGEGSSAGKTYAQIPGTDDYYECNFSGSMPELDFDNPDVRAEVLDIARYYLDLGVDGFRFDAAKYVYFGENGRSADFWDWYIAELTAIKPDIYTVAEVWDGEAICDIYYSSMSCFNFSVSQVSGLIAETAKHGDVNRYTSYVDSFIDRTQAINPATRLVMFVTNHDMDRAAGFLTVASGQMNMAANLYILAPGSPFIYYGEEIGMRGSRGGTNTDANRRLAMLWGDGDKVKDPTGTTYPSSKQVEESVKDQLADGDSLLSYYKRLIMIRAANPEIARGGYTALKFSGTKLGGFTSTWNGSSVTVIHNTTGSEISVTLPDEVTASEISAVIGQEEASLDGRTLTIGSMTSVVLR